MRARYGGDVCAAKQLRKSSYRRRLHGVRQTPTYTRLIPDSDRQTPTNDRQSPTVMQLFCFSALFSLCSASDSGFGVGEDIRTISDLQQACVCGFFLWYERAAATQSQNDQPHDTGLG